MQRENFLVFNFFKKSRWLSIFMAGVFLLNICSPAWAREGNYGPKSAGHMLASGAIAVAATTVAAVTGNPWSVMGASVFSDVAGYASYYYLYNSYGQTMKIPGLGVELKLGHMTISKGQFYSMVAGVVGGKLAGFTAGLLSNGGGSEGAPEDAKNTNPPDNAGPSTPPIDLGKALSAAETVAEKADIIKSALEKAAAAAKEATDKLNAAKEATDKLNAAKLQSPSFLGSFANAVGVFFNNLIKKGFAAAKKSFGILFKQAVENFKYKLLHPGQYLLTQFNNFKDKLKAIKEDKLPADPAFRAGREGNVGSLIKLIGSGLLINFVKMFVYESVKQNLEHGIYTKSGKKIIGPVDQAIAESIADLVSKEVTSYVYAVVSKAVAGNNNAIDAQGGPLTKGTGKFNAGPVGLEPKSETQSLTEKEALKNEKLMTAIKKGNFAKMKFAIQRDNGETITLKGSDINGEVLQKLQELSKLSVSINTKTGEQAIPLADNPKLAEAIAKGEDLSKMKLTLKNENGDKVKVVEGNIKDSGIKKQLEQSLTINTKSPGNTSISPYDFYRNCSRTDDNGKAVSLVDDIVDGNITSDKLYEASFKSGKKVTFSGSQIDEGMRKQLQTMHTMDGAINAMGESGSKLISGSNITVRELCNSAGPISISDRKIIAKKANKNSMLSVVSGGRTVEVDTAALNADDVKNITAYSKATDLLWKTGGQYGVLSMVNDQRQGATMPVASVDAAGAIGSFSERSISLQDLAKLYTVSQDKNAGKVLEFYLGDEHVAILAKDLKDRVTEKIQGFSTLISSTQYQELFQMTGGLPYTIKGEDMNTMESARAGWEAVRNMGLSPLVATATRIAMLEALSIKDGGYHTHRGDNRQRIFENSKKMAIAGAVTNIVVDIFNNADSLQETIYGLSSGQNHLRSRGQMSKFEYFTKRILDEGGALLSQLAWANYCREKDISPDAVDELQHLAWSSFSTSFIDLFRQNRAMNKEVSGIETFSGNLANNISLFPRSVLGRMGDLFVEASLDSVLYAPTTRSPGTGLNAFMNQQNMTDNYIFYVDAMVRGASPIDITLMSLASNLNYRSNMVLGHSLSSALFNFALPKPLRSYALFTSKYGIRNYNINAEVKQNGDEADRKLARNQGKDILEDNEKAGKLQSEHPEGIADLKKLQTQIMIDSAMQIILSKFGNDNLVEPSADTYSANFVGPLTDVLGEDFTKTLAARASKDRNSYILETAEKYYLAKPIDPSMKSQLEMVKDFAPPRMFTLSFSNSALRPTGNETWTNQMFAILNGENYDPSLNINARAIEVNNLPLYTTKVAKLEEATVDQFGRLKNTYYYGLEYNKATGDWDTVKLNKYSQHFYGPFGHQLSVTSDSSQPAVLPTQQLSSDWEVKAGEYWDKIAGDFSQATGVAPVNLAEGFGIKVNDSEKTPEALRSKFINYVESQIEKGNIDIVKYINDKVEGIAKNHSVGVSEKSIGGTNFENYISPGKIKGKDFIVDENSEKYKQSQEAKRALLNGGSIIVDGLEVKAIGVPKSELSELVKRFGETYKDKESGKMRTYRDDFKDLIRKTWKGKSGKIRENEVSTYLCAHAMFTPRADGREWKDLSAEERQKVLYGITGWRLATELFYTRDGVKQTLKEGGKTTNVISLGNRADAIDLSKVETIYVPGIVVPGKQVKAPEIMAKPVYETVTSASKGPNYFYDLTFYNTGGKYSPFSGPATQVNAQLLNSGLNKGIIRDKSVAFNNYNMFKNKFASGISEFLNQIALPSWSIEAIENEDGSLKTIAEQYFYDSDEISSQIGDKVGSDEQLKKPVSDLKALQIASVPNIVGNEVALLAGNSGIPGVDNPNAYYIFYKKYEGENPELLGKEIFSKSGFKKNAVTVTPVTDTKGYQESYGESVKSMRQALDRINLEQLDAESAPPETFIDLTKNKPIIKASDINMLPEIVVVAPSEVKAIEPAAIKPLQVDKLEPSHDPAVSVLSAPVVTKEEYQDKEIAIDKYAIEKGILKTARDNSVLFKDQESAEQKIGVEQPISAREKAIASSLTKTTEIKAIEWLPKAGEKYRIEYLEYMNHPAYKKRLAKEMFGDVELDSQKEQAVSIEYDRRKKAVQGVGIKNNKLENPDFGGGYLPENHKIETVLPEVLYHELSHAVELNSSGLNMNESGFNGKKEEFISIPEANLKLQEAKCAFAEAIAEAILKNNIGTDLPNYSRIVKDLQSVNLKEKPEVAINYYNFYSQAKEILSKEPKIKELELSIKALELENNYYKSNTEIKARLNDLRLKAVKDYQYNQNSEFDINNFDKLRSSDSYLDLKYKGGLTDKQINELMKYTADNNINNVSNKINSLPSWKPTSDNNV